MRKHYPQQVPVVAVLLYFFLYNFGALSAQNVPLNSCENIGFEKGDFTGWRGEYGTTRDNIFGRLIEEEVRTGIVTGRHTIMIKAQGNDPRIRQEQIPVVSNGNFSVRLGNNSSGKQFERLMTTFRVAEDNTLFVYRFAVVLQDPDHKAVQQPKFDVRVLDRRGKTISCGYYRVAAASSIPGFKNQNDLRFRQWTTAAIDLRDYAGELVTIQFTTYDCTEGDHYGYAYIDAECMSSRIFPSYFCPGLDTTITLNAPEGFDSYRWSTGERTRSITLVRPQAGAKYTVFIRPFSSLADDCEYPLEFIIPEKIERPLLAQDSLRFCGNDTLQIKALDDQFESYRWTRGKNGPEISTEASVKISAPGWYYLEARDRSCIFTDSVAAQKFPEPTLDFKVDPPRCANDSSGRIALIGGLGPGWELLWSTGDTLATLTGLAAGTYAVTLTDQEQGCTVSRSFDFTPPNVLTASISLEKRPGCGQANDPGEALIRPTGGVGPYQVRWSTGDTTRRIAVRQAGFLTAILTDSLGCQWQDTLLVQPFVVQTTISPITCPGERNGTLRVSAAGGGGGYRFRLGNGPLGLDSVFQNLAAGTYTLEVSAANGCRQLTTVELPAPSFPEWRFAAQAPRCAGERTGEIALVSPRLPGWRLRWNTGDTLSTLRNLGSGQYRVTLTDPVRGCTSSQVFDFPVQEPLRAAIQPIRSPGCDTSGRPGLVGLNLSGGNRPYRIRWSNGDTLSNLSVATPGWVRVEVADAQGCRQRDSLLLRAFSLELLAQPSDCVGDRTGQIRVRSVGGSLLQYQLNDGPFVRDSAFTRLAPGSYRITVRDAQGCWQRKMVELPAPVPFTVNLPREIVVKMGDDLLLQPIFSIRAKSWEWQSAAGPCTNCPELRLPRLINDQIVKLQATDAKNCAAIAQTRIIVRKDYSVYIPNAFSPNGDGQNELFELYLGGNVERVRKLEIFNRWGSLVFAATGAGPSSPQWDGTFRGELLRNEVLVYKAEVEFIDGAVRMFTGSLVVVR